MIRFVAGRRGIGDEMTATNETTIPVLAAPDPIELAIAKIEDPETPDAEVLATMDKLDFILERAKRLKKAGDASMTARVKAKGPLQFGNWEYCLSRDRKVKVRDINAVAEAVLEGTVGDLKKFCDLLSSEPFKQGAVKQLVGEEKWGALYQVIIDEFAEKKLKKINKLFAKKK